MVDRIRAEYNKIRSNRNPQISVGLISGNIRNWRSSIMGASNTPYYGGQFLLDIVFPDEYPNRPPTIRFLTPIYHPNISTSGNICINVLSRDWNPILGMEVVLNYIIALMANPNPNSPLNTPAANDYKNNISEFNRKASEMVRESFN